MLGLAVFYGFCVKSLELSLLENIVAIYPVIMCGGAGTRLWPASRLQKPKQFIALASEKTLFQDTVLRVSGLVAEGGRLIVVAGASHEKLVKSQLEEVGVEAHLIVEPEGRDSAPAMCAAALWTQRRDPDGINVFVSSDHYLPDVQAFQQSVSTACQAAERGKIVTLGVQPTAPSTAYGYIHPSGEGLSDVVEFVEKPDVHRALSFIERGFVWNTGIFITKASVLVGELQSYEPKVVEAVGKALPDNGHRYLSVLSQDFASSPKISIDYAVMEQTSLASVLKVDFNWSDLGAWDAVAASAPQNASRHVLIDSPGSYVRAPDDVVVSVLGGEQLAVVVERDAVLVCALSRSQDVKKLVERMRETSPAQLDFPLQGGNLFEDGRDFLDWMKRKALPVWSSFGQREDGLFAEELSFAADAVECNHRVRVQARQLFTYSAAGQLGWQGPWRQICTKGLAAFKNYCCNEHGRLYGAIPPSLEVLKSEGSVYDNAFGIFALSHMMVLEKNRDALESRAKTILQSVLSLADKYGAIVETEDQAHQSNAHMHLLEACMAWEARSEDPIWAETSDRVVRLALAHFIDAEQGFLREFFNADWQPADGVDGQRVEPGHQFEWAWLLMRYAKKRSRPDVYDAATRLYEHGLKGLWREAGVLVDAMDEQARPIGYTARLWPQTEWLRAALLMAIESEGDVRDGYLYDAERALSAVKLYITQDGLWHDCMKAVNQFDDGHAKGSSLYHIMGACRQMIESFNYLGEPASLGKLK